MARMQMRARAVARGESPDYAQTVRANAARACGQTVTRARTVSLRARAQAIWLYVC